MTWKWILILQEDYSHLLVFTIYMNIQSKKFNPLIS